MRPHVGCFLSGQHKRANGEHENEAPQQCRRLGILLHMNARTSRRKRGFGGACVGVLVSARVPLGGLGRHRPRCYWGRPARQLLLLRGAQLLKERRAGAHCGRVPEIHGCTCGARLHCRAITSSIGAVRSLTKPDRPGTCARATQEKPAFLRSTSTEFCSQWCADAGPEGPIGHTLFSEVDLEL